MVCLEKNAKALPGMQVLRDGRGLRNCAKAIPATVNIRLLSSNAPARMPRAQRDDLRRLDAKA